MRGSLKVKCSTTDDTYLSHDCVGVIPPVDMQPCLYDTTVT